MKIFAQLLTLLVIGSILGCSKDVHSPHPATSAGHHHTAPHGGTLVALGDEFAHLEFVLDPTDGTLTAYVLDGEAENAVRLSGQPLDLSIGENRTLTLEPVADELTGETVDDTATYRVTSEDLKGVEEFQGVLDSIDVKGQTFQSVSFEYPQGNEAEHSHEH
jgi:hypothetical protein